MSNQYIPYKACLLVTLLISVSCNSQKPFLEGVSLKRDSYPEKLDAFGEFLWSRNMDNSIILNKKHFKQIHRNCESSEDVYFDLLEGYNVFLTSKKRKIGKGLSLSESAYVAGHVVEYLYKCQKKFKKEDPYKDSKFVYRLLAYWNMNDYNREFKMHDYYGLKLLKKHHLKYYKYFPDEDTIPSIKRVID